MQAAVAAPQSQPPPAPSAYSDKETFTDANIFNKLKDKGQWLFLPRYRLETQVVSGEQQFRVRFIKRGTDSDLEIYLEKYPAPGLADDLRQERAGDQARLQTIEQLVRAAQEVPHEAEVHLRYELPVGGPGTQAKSIRDLRFQELTLEKTDVKAVLHLEQLQQRDEVVQALQNSGSNATLLAKRTVTVLTIPEAEYNALMARVKEMDESQLAPLRFKADNCGEATWQARNAKLRELIRNNLPHDAICEEIQKPLRARLAELMAERNGVHNTAIETIRKKVPKTVTLDVSVPFFFDRTLHPYVYAGIIPNPQSPQLVRKQVSWQERSFSYFRPADRTDLWYYLPDQFVLGGQASPLPLRVEFSGPPENQIVLLDYVGVPWTNPERLKAAEAALRPATNSPVTLEPLLVKNAQLWVALPGSGGGEQRPGASVDLRDGLKDQLRLKLEDFQKIYGALFSASPMLFKGDVRFDLDSTASERIPFEARVTGQTPQELWDKLISHAVLAEYEKTIQVKTLPTVFTKGVKALVVTFQEGDTVELHQNQLNAHAKVRLRMRDFILNTEQSGAYHYKVTTIREGGGKTEMPSWKVVTTTILYPEVP